MSRNVNDAQRIIDDATSLVRVIRDEQPKKKGFLSRVLRRTRSKKSHALRSEITVPLPESAPIHSARKAASSTQKATVIRVTSPRRLASATSPNPSPIATGVGGARTLRRTLSQGSTAGSHTPPLLTMFSALHSLVGSSVASMSAGTVEASFSSSMSVLGELESVLSSPRHPPSRPSLRDRAKRAALLRRTASASEWEGQGRARMVTSPSKGAWGSASPSSGPRHDIAPSPPLSARAASRHLKPRPVRAPLHATRADVATPSRPRDVTRAPPLPLSALTAAAHTGSGADAVVAVLTSARSDPGAYALMSPASSLCLTPIQAASRAPPDRDVTWAASVPRVMSYLVQPGNAAPTSPHVHRAPSPQPATVLRLCRVSSAPARPFSAATPVAHLSRTFSCDVTSVGSPSRVTSLVRSTPSPSPSSPRPGMAVGDVTRGLPRPLVSPVPADLCRSPPQKQCHVGNHVAFKRGHPRSFAAGRGSDPPTVAPSGNDVTRDVIPVDVTSPSWFELDGGSLVRDVTHIGKDARDSPRAAKRPVVATDRGRPVARLLPRLIHVTETDWRRGVTSPTRFELRLESQARPPDQSCDTAPSESESEPGQRSPLPEPPIAASAPPLRDVIPITAPSANGVRTHPDHDVTRPSGAAGKRAVRDVTADVPAQPDTPGRNPIRVRLTSEVPRQRPTLVVSPTSAAMSTIQTPTPSSNLKWGARPNPPPNGDANATRKPSPTHATLTPTPAANTTATNLKPKPKAPSTGNPSPARHPSLNTNRSAAPAGDPTPTPTLKPTHHATPRRHAPNGSRCVDGPAQLSACADAGRDPKSSIAQAARPPQNPAPPPTVPPPPSPPTNPPTLVPAPSHAPNLGDASLDDMIASCPRVSVDAQPSPKNSRRNAHSARHPAHLVPPAATPPPQSAPGAVMRVAAPSNTCDVPIAVRVLQHHDDQPDAPPVTRNVTPPPLPGRLTVLTSAAQTPTPSTAPRDVTLVARPSSHDFGSPSRRLSGDMFSSEGSGSPRLDTAALGCHRVLFLTTPREPAAAKKQRSGPENTCSTKKSGSVLFQY